MKMKIAIIREPCLMEDEGRHFLIGAFDSFEEAESFIEAYTADGYFSLSDCSYLTDDGLPASEKYKLPPFKRPHWVKAEKALRAATVEGIKKGIEAYAWWKDGTQYVGTCGCTLKLALEDVDNSSISSKDII